MDSKLANWLVADQRGYHPYGHLSVGYPRISSYIAVDNYRIIHSIADQRGYPIMLSVNHIKSSVVPVNPTHVISDIIPYSLILSVGWLSLIITSS